MKKIPIERTCAEFWKVEFIPDPTPRCCGGRLFITPARFGAANAPIASPFITRSDANTGIREIHRKERQQQERHGREHHAAACERSGPVPVGEESRHRAGEQESRSQRKHVDAGPKRGPREVVSVLGEPYPLKPDDQHEHQPAAPDAREQRRQASSAERPDTEQRQAEHRIGDLRLDDAEGREERRRYLRGS